MGKLYWRKTIDDCWDLEEDAPEYQPTADDTRYNDSIPGRRPVASVWQWSSVAEKPWMAILAGVPFSNRRYKTLASAQHWTLKRAERGR